MTIVPAGPRKALLAPAVQDRRTEPCLLRRYSFDAQVAYHALIEGIELGCPQRTEPISRRDVMKTYVREFLAEPVERIASIRSGVGQAAVVALAIDLNIPVRTLRRDLRVPNGSGRCNTPATERILGLMALIGQVDTMVHRSNPDVSFGAAAWLGNWLSNPVAALGGVRPATLLDTMTGVAFLSDLLAVSESGAFA